MFGHIPGVSDKREYLESHVALTSAVSVTHQSVSRKQYDLLRNRDNITGNV